MRRVYIAENLADAHLVSNLIQSHGIETHVFNEFSHGAVGELPFTHTWPEVWVKNDRDESRALEIVESREIRPYTSDEYICKNCEQPNPANFDICWNCSASLNQTD